MELQDYQTSAKRTVNWKLDENMQLAGLMLGIVGELGELRKVMEGPYSDYAKWQEKIKDEGGDVLWYVVNLCSLLSLDWTEFFPETVREFIKPRQLFDEANGYTAFLADAVKKKAVQGHVLDFEKVLYGLNGLTAALLELFYYFGLSPEEICTYNQEKLAKRYPNGFESSRSIAREA